MLTLKITPDGREPYELVCKTRHIVAWEKLGRGRGLAQLEKPRMTDLAEIAHVTAVREKRFTGSFDEFLDSHDVSSSAADEAAAEKTLDADDEAGPTQPAP